MSEERVIEAPFVEWHEVAVSGEVEVEALIAGLVGAFGDRLANWQMTDGEAVYVALWTPAQAQDADLVALAVSGAISAE